MNIIEKILEDISKRTILLNATINSCKKSKRDIDKAMAIKCGERVDELHKMKELILKRKLESKAKKNSSWSKKPPI